MEVFNSIAFHGYNILSLLILILYIIDQKRINLVKSTSSQYNNNLQDLLYFYLELIFIKDYIKFALGQE
jgi:hypothetical protein